MEDMDSLNLKKAFAQLPSDLPFREWVKLVENEQLKSAAMLNIILNRQLLYYYWVNGYNPVDTLNEVLADED